MKFFSSLLIMLSFNTLASECEISPGLLSAYYTVTQQASTNNTTGKSRVKTLELHRNNNRVIQRNMSLGINDTWSINGDRISLHRAFDQYQHSIEYQPNELRHAPKWQDVNQIVAIPDRHNMTLLTQKNIGCNVEQHYSMTTPNAEYQLIWMPQLQLVKSFKLKTATGTQQWLLSHYQDNLENIASLFNQYDTYQSTDYADIGDNESIPFLAAMINQGFSATSVQQVKSHNTSDRHHHDH